MKTQTYKDLIVWQKSKKLVLEIYALAEQFPPSEKFGITSQLTRAAISIPLNIAEGYRRRGDKERAQFFSIAFGSAAEVEALIDICKDLHLFKNCNFTASENLLDEVLRMLNVFIKNSSLHSTRYSPPSPQKGFTILELIVVLGIFAVIAGVAAVQLANFQRGTVLESTSKDVVSALRLAHDKAMLGEDGDSNGQGDAWGIRFANSTTDTYASFYGAAYNVNNVKETVYLSPPLAFSAPTEGNNTDVIFTKLSGTTTSANITIGDNGQIKTVTVDASGRISSN